jgi:hypothetical protein
MAEIDPPWLRSKKRKPSRYLWRQARRRALLKGIPFDLTEDDVVIPERCPVLGIPLGFDGGLSERGSSPSLDRIDPSRGYVRGNVLVISFRANQIKSDATPEELRMVAAFFSNLSPPGDHS